VLGTWYFELGTWYFELGTLSFELGTLSFELGTLSFELGTLCFELGTLSFELGTLCYAFPNALFATWLRVCDCCRQPKKPLKISNELRRIGATPADKKLYGFLVA